jgi:hypothetical protein
MMRHAVLSLLIVIATAWSISASLPANAADKPLTQCNTTCNDAAATQAQFISVPSLQYGQHEVSAAELQATQQPKTSFKPLRAKHRVYRNGFFTTPI